MRRAEKQLIKLTQKLQSQAIDKYSHLNLLKDEDDLLLFFRVYTAVFLRLSSPHPSLSHPSSANIWATTVLTTIAVVFYVLMIVFCCIPCSLSSDIKLTRLFDPYIAGSPLDAEFALHFYK
ncbi:unnamed protein product [Cylicocyclus nassatus]|uniref:Uncharacterized protein n=1 Tax=Cylicocyclus nassatus TaxID=53992 RepID=A0AA36HC85_CYLNA|nr:unnamed protein product [Cylicocyclus nassatus]